MKLKIGIATMQPAWKLILQQEGLDFEFVDLGNEIHSGDYSVLIINKPINAVKKGNLNSYLLKGGAAIVSSSVYADMYQFNIRSAGIKYCLPAEDSVFADLGLIDFHSRFRWLDSPKIEELDSELKIQFQKIGKGFALILPFSVNELILNTKSVRRKFPAEHDELPSEIVAQVSKGKVREIIGRCLKFLHDQRNIPYVQKWRFPFDWKNLFLFRIDTDYCTAEEALTLHDICRQNKIGGTWFVDTASAETLNQVYANLPDQEIALHCRRHLVFKDYRSNLENIENGLSDLRNAGINVTGFAAPFGDWNQNLARVLAEKGFLYSSEFALDYDDLPFYPILYQKAIPVLQIPIHPISTGRLNRSHFTEEEMCRYYRDYIDDCLKTNHPIFLYHHPSHGKFVVIESIFNYIIKRNINTLQYSEYAGWWKRRTDLTLECSYSNDALRLERNVFPEDIFIKISTGEKFALSAMQKKIELSSLVWQDRMKADLKKDLLRTRKWHWRDLLYDYESRKGKRKR